MTAIVVGVVLHVWILGPAVWLTTEIQALDAAAALRDDHVRTGLASCLCPVVGQPHHTPARVSFRTRAELRRHSRLLRRRRTAPSPGPRRPVVAC